jgi:hypothetical protein
MGIEPISIVEVATTSVWGFQGRNKRSMKEYLDLTMQFLLPVQERSGYVQGV